MKNIFFIITTLFSISTFAACLYDSKEFPAKSILKQVDSYKICAHDTNKKNRWVDAGVVEVSTGCLYADILYPENSILKQVNTHKICTQKTAGKFSWKSYKL